MQMRALKREEIEAIWTLDRREIHHHVYRLVDDKLILVPFYFDIPGWPPDQVEQDTPLLYDCFDRGGLFLAMFDNDQLVGIAVLDSVPFGENRECLKLDKLYVSRDYRSTGVGTRLFEEAKVAAHARGARSLYVSATPTENTVNFYLRRGCTPAQPPNPKLLALEPEDIHLVCPLP